VNPLELLVSSTQRIQHQPFWVLKKKKFILSVLNIVQPIQHFLDNFIFFRIFFSHAIGQAANTNVKQISRTFSIESS
jgi:hypothetical protein